MLKNLNIGKKLFLLCSIPILCLVGLGVVVTGGAINNFARQNETKTAQKLILEVDEMVVSVTRLVGDVRGYIISPENKDYQQAYEKEINNFHEIYNRLDKQIQNPELRKELTIILEEINYNESTAKNVFQLVDQEQWVQAKVLVKLLNLEKINEARDEILKKQTAILDEKEKAAANAEKMLIILVLLGTGLSILFTIIVGIWIARKINTNISIVVSIAEKVSVGDLTSELKADLTNKDEIGQLLNSFQRMTNNLNSLILHVQQSTIQVTSSADKITAFGKQLEAMATEQVASTNQAAATAKQIAVTSAQLVETMDVVESSSQATARSAGDSQKDLILIATFMRKLADATSILSAKQRDINEKANKINNFITTITKVADQTNLLSLNATIEAEKAGEYGAGFAVVAKQIRRLANQSAVATLDIEKMVEEMHEAISAGMMEMEKFTQEVEQGVEDVLNISAKLESIIQEVQIFTPQLHEVGNRVEVQAQGAQEISEEMLQLSEVSLQTVASLQEINDAIEQLNQTAQGLRQEISLFKVLQEVR